MSRKMQLWWDICNVLQRETGGRSNEMKKTKVIQKKLVALKDIVIPKGTVFEHTEGKVEYISGNYTCYVGTGKDTVMHIGISEDELEYGEGNFAEIKD